MGRIFLLFLIFGIIFLVIPSIIMTSNTPEAVQANAIQQQAAAGICGSVYTVLAGDTISLIAQKCGLTTAAILAANPALQSPYWIYPGQQISLPGVSGPGIPNTGGSTYTVTAGDTLSEIAAAYNTTVQALVNANPAVTNPDLIYVGQVLTLPSGSSPGIPNTGGDSYTIVSGDTLYAIARRNNTTVQNLLNLNPSITNADLIFPGTLIRIR